MAFNTSEYLNKSNELLSTGRDLLISLQAGTGVEQAKTAVEDATKSSVAADLGFTSAPGILEDPGASTDEGLWALLYDFQSANLLIAAGVATEGPSPAAQYLSQALSQIEAAQAEANSSSSLLGFEFEAGSVVKSADLHAARQSFKTDSQFALEQLVKEAEGVVESAFEQVKSLGGDKIQAAIESIGKSFPAVAEVGRLVKKGIEKLKAAIQSLFDLLGAAGLTEVKKRVTEVWNKLTKGEYTAQLLAWIFGVNETHSRIETLLGRTDLTIEKLDGGSNKLRPLTEGYATKVRLIKALLAAVTLIAAALKFFHAALPWLPAALAAAYLSLMGAAVVIGMNYSGSGGALQWVTGVREIVEGI
jgi:hypothetical protein